MISSLSLERCIMSIEHALRNSTQKSRSETPSRLFSATAEKPKSSASYALSVGYVVPARAQQPMGETSMRFAVSSKRPTSL